MSTYSDKLKDPRWQKKRLEIFERDNWTCQFCGNTDKTLAVHHLEYIKGNCPWEYNNESLLTICDDCHNQEHEFRRETENELLNQLSMSKFSWMDIYYLMYDNEKLKIISKENKTYDQEEISKYLKEKENV